MKSSRLIKIVSLLETRNIITTKEFSELLSVSSRTIRRDIDYLSYLGYPITSMRGRNGGWYLLDHFKSSLKSLTDDELYILSLRPSDKVLQDLEIYSDKLTLDSKLTKSNSSLKAFSTNHYVYIDSIEWFEEMKNNAYVSTLHRAIKDRAKISMHYTNSRGETKIYDVEGLGLVFKSNKWYFVAQKESQLLRTFKVSRIEQVEMLDIKYEYPEDFSIENYWKESKISFQNNAEQFLIKVEVEKENVDYIHNFFKIIDTEIAPSRKLILSLVFDNELSAVRTLTGFVDLINDITPLYLMDRIHSNIKKLARKN